MNSGITISYGRRGRRGQGKKWRDDMKGGKSQRKGGKGEKMYREREKKE